MPTARRVCSSPITSLTSTAARSIRLTITSARSFAATRAKSDPPSVPHAVIFAENVTLENSLRWTEEDGPNVANAAHWYDVLTLFFKDHISFFSIDPYTRRFTLGAQRVRRMFAKQLHGIKHWGIHEMNQAPTVIGEFGVPFDLEEEALLPQRRLRPADPRARFVPRRDGREPAELDAVELHAGQRQSLG